MHVLTGEGSRKLTSLFGLKYVTTLAISPEKASRSGLWRMLGLTEAEWATVCQMYLRFFSEGQPNLPRNSVKGHVFEFMFSVLRKESSADPLFNNGAGKPFINPRRACARVTVLALCVCVSVCPSVTALAASASAYTCSQRYSRLCLGYMCGFLKKPSVQELWREKANMQMS